MLFNEVHNLLTRSTESIKSFKKTGLCECYTGVHFIITDALIKAAGYCCSYS